MFSLMRTMICKCINWHFYRKIFLDGEILIMLCCNLWFPVFNSKIFFAFFNSAIQPILYPFAIFNSAISPTSEVQFAIFNSTFFLCKVCFFPIREKSQSFKWKDWDKKHLFNKNREQVEGARSFLTPSSPIPYQKEFKDLPVVANFPSFSVPCISVRYHTL